MNKRVSIRYLLVCLLLWFITGAALAAGTTAAQDPRIKNLLQKANLEYQFDDKAGFKLVNRFSTERLQAIFIESTTQRVGDMEVRKIWSLASLQDKLDPALLHRLLVDNQNVKIGRWSIAQVNGKEAAIFSATIDADARLGELLANLSIVAGAADELERSLGEKDAY